MDPRGGLKVNFSQFSMVHYNFSLIRCVNIDERKGHARLIMPEVELSDSKLIQAFENGDMMAFETLYRRYRRQLYGFLSNLIPGNPAEVDEVFEETWLRVIEKLPKYRDDGKFSAWLFRISRNLFIDRVRRNRMLGMGTVWIDSEDAPEIMGLETMSPDRELNASELEKVISDALSKLPSEQREVFLLRQQELPFREIAEIQQCSINTVLGRMQYAIKSLRKLILAVDHGGIIK